jgi:hypothetical protein
MSLFKESSNNILNLTEKGYSSYHTSFQKSVDFPFPIFFYFFIKQLFNPRVPFQNWCCPCFFFCKLIGLFFIYFYQTLLDTFLTFQFPNPFSQETDIHASKIKNPQASLDFGSAHSFPINQMILFCGTTTLTQKYFSINIHF